MERENRAEARTELELETEAEMEDQGGGKHLSRKGTGMFRPCRLFSLLATDSHLRLQAAGV